MATRVRKIPSPGAPQRRENPHVWHVALCAAFLLLLNAFLVRDLFRIEYTRHMGSIEGAYIAIIRHLLEHGPGDRWFPLWYAGIPFQNTYPPLLPILAFATARVLGISPAVLSRGCRCSLQPGGRDLISNGLQAVPVATL
jgi:hypothetical protein